MTRSSLPAALRRPFAWLAGRLFRHRSPEDDDAGRWGEEVAAKWLAGAGFDAEAVEEDALRHRAPGDCRVGGSGER